MESTRVDVTVEHDLDHASAHRPHPQFVGGADRTDPPVRQDADDVAQSGLLDELGGDHEGLARRRDLTEVVPEAGAQDGVDAGRRLVEQQDLRIVHEGGGQPETTLHPARGLADQLLAVLVEVDQVQQSVQSLRPPERDPVERRVEVEVLPQRQLLEEDRVLGEVAEFGAVRAATVARGDALHLDRALVGTVHPVHQPDDGGLAGPGRPDEPDDAPGGDRQVDVSQDPGVAEPLAEALAPDDDLAVVRSPIGIGRRDGVVERVRPGAAGHGMIRRSTTWTTPSATSTSLDTTVAGPNVTAPSAEVTSRV